jgi:hypothetical protein
MRTEFKLENMKGKTRRRWVNNIEMGVNEVRCDGVDSIHLTQEIVECWVAARGVVNLQSSIKSTKFMRF